MRNSSPRDAEGPIRNRVGQIVTALTSKGGRLLVGHLSEQEGKRSRDEAENAGGGAASSKKKTKK